MFRVVLIRNINSNKTPLQLQCNFISVEKKHFAHNPEPLLRSCNSRIPFYVRTWAPKSPGWIWKNHPALNTLPCKQPSGNCATRVQVNGPAFKQDLPMAGNKEQMLLQCFSLYLRYRGWCELNSRRISHRCWTPWGRQQFCQTVQDIPFPSEDSDPRTASGRERLCV